MSADKKTSGVAKKASRSGDAPALVSYVALIREIPNLAQPAQELPPKGGERQPGSILAPAVQELPSPEVMAVFILCREKNRVVAEPSGAWQIRRRRTRRARRRSSQYALRDIKKPVGVSGYVTRLVETLPAPIKDAVPSVEELERGLTDLTE